MPKFHFTSVPVYLVHTDGSTQKTPKSLLFKELETQVLFENSLLWLMARSSYDLLKNYQKSLLTSKVNFKKVYAVSNVQCINLIFGKTILPWIKDWKTEKRC